MPLDDPGQQRLAALLALLQAVLLGVLGLLLALAALLDGAIAALLRRLAALAVEPPDAEARPGGGVTERGGR